MRKVGIIAQSNGMCELCHYVVRQSGVLSCWGERRDLAAVLAVEASETLAVSSTVIASTAIRTIHVAQVPRLLRGPRTGRGQTL